MKQWWCTSTPGISDAASSRGFVGGASWSQILMNIRITNDLWDYLDTVLRVSTRLRAVSLGRTGVYCSTDYRTLRRGDQPRHNGSRGRDYPNLRRVLIWRRRKDILVFRL